MKQMGNKIIIFTAVKNEIFRQFISKFLTFQDISYRQFSMKSLNTIGLEREQQLNFECGTILLNQRWRLIENLNQVNVLGSEKVEIQSINCVMVSGVAVKVGSNFITIDPNCHLSSSFTSFVLPIFLPVPVFVLVLVTESIE